MSLQKADSIDDPEEPYVEKLQALGVLHAFSIALFFPIITTFLPIYLLFTCFWPVVILYSAWLYYDWNSPCRGGYALPWMKNMRMHKYYAQYFPVRLHKTAKLPPDQNYIVGYHPHGILSIGAFVNFATNGTGILERFPKLSFHLCTMRIQFLSPIKREWVLMHGVIDCCKESISNILNHPDKGKVCVLVVGGAEESLNAHPGNHELVIHNRKGFIKLALESGASLVPCYSFGENDVFNQTENPRGSTLRSIQTKIKYILGFTIPLFHGFGILPFRKPINTVLGAPILVEKSQEPTDEEIESLHAKYIEKLTELFESQKSKYGVPPDAKLVFC